MSVDRANVVLLGHGKDRHGFPCDILRDAQGRIYNAYSLEVWEERCKHVQRLQRLSEYRNGGRRPPQQKER